MSARPVWLTMPSVTVWSSPNGLPITSTHSATTTWSESPSGTNGSGRLASILSSATSDSASAPTTRAGSARRLGPEVDLDRLRALDDVRVRDHPAVAMDQEAGANPLARALVQLLEQLAELLVVRARRWRLRRDDPDHRGDHRLGELRQIGQSLRGLGQRRRGVDLRVQRARGVRRQAPLQPTPPRRAPPSPTCPPPPANVGSRTRWGPCQRLRKEAKLGGAPRMQRGSGYGRYRCADSSSERTRSSARRSASV